MASTQIAPESSFKLDKVLAGISDLETSDLEHIRQRVNLVLAGRRVPSLREEESLLLQKINNRLTPAVWLSYNNLHKKMQQETISHDEHQELLALIEQIETTNVEWLKCIVALAQLRAITPQALMHQLGLSSVYAKKDS